VLVEMDDIFGRLFRALEETGQLENTLIFVTWCNECNTATGPYGECIGGKLQGKRLTGVFPVPQFWSAWSEFNTDTDVYAGKGLAPR